MADQKNAKFTSLIPRAVTQAERKISSRLNKEDHNSTFRNQELSLAKSLLEKAGISVSDKKITDRLSATPNSAWRIFQKRRKASSERKQAKADAEAKSIFNKVMNRSGDR